jgi:N-dimethylarginine dimethylaminohydrolase
MQTHATDRSKRVLELAGDGSRTETQNTERLIAYLDKLADVEPAPVRIKEKVLALIACFLAVGYLEGGELATKVVQERYAQEGCVAQFGPGEYHRNPKFRCAPMVEAPNYVLTMPVGQQ